MMNIRRIHLREIHLPLKEPFEISSGIVQTRRIMLLQLEDADGVTAWSECVAESLPNYYPDTVETARIAVREYIAPKILGKKLSGPEEIFDLLESDFRGHSMAKAAVEMGMWALKAKVERVPLAKLIGGTREKIGVGISVGLQQSPEDLATKVRQYAAEGYQKIKLKIKPGKDIEFVKKVREKVGNDVHLMVDANNAYSLDDAPLLKQLDAFDLMMIEQPLAWDDLVRHAELQKQLKTPICLDESITGPGRAEDMIKLGSGKIINIKPGRVGGFTSAKRIHDLCQRHKIPVWCGGMLESGIGRAYNVALASLPNFVFPGDISPSSRYWKRDIVQPEWTMDSKGFVKVPLDKPGIGVSLEMEYLEEITVWKETLG